MAYVNTAAFSTRYQSRSADDQPVVMDGLGHELARAKVEIPAAGGVKQFVMPKRDARRLARELAWITEREAFARDQGFSGLGRWGGGGGRGGGGRRGGGRGWGRGFAYGNAYPVLYAPDTYYVDDDLTPTDTEMAALEAKFKAQGYMREDEFFTANNFPMMLATIMQRLARNQRTLGDLGWGGWGGSIIHKVTETVKKVVSKPTSVLQATVKPAFDIATGLMMKPRATESATGGTEYYDANGKKITKAEYDELMKQYNADVAKRPVVLPPPTPLVTGVTKPARKAKWELVSRASKVYSMPDEGGSSGSPAAAGFVDFGRAGSYGTLPSVEGLNGLPHPEIGVEGLKDFFSDVGASLRSAGKAVKKAVVDVGQVAKSVIPAPIPPLDMSQPLPDVTPTAPSAPVASPRSNNTALWIGGGVAAVAVLGLIVYLAARKKR